VQLQYRQWRIQGWGHLTLTVDPHWLQAKFFTYSMLLNQQSRSVVSSSIKQ
jgi:hypothetical protein